VINSNGSAYKSLLKRGLEASAGYTVNNKVIPCISEINHWISPESIGQLFFAFMF
jgi:hypothetical protein